MFEPIPIGKLEAARRQLETAVNLYFHQGDLVSIHTLACAGHEIVERINQGQGGKPTLKQSWKDDLKPEAVKSFYERLNHAKNFFKHAGKDERQTVLFAPFESDIVLLDACWTYRRITGERQPILGVFELWAAITWGAEFISYPGLDVSVPPASTWAALSRQEYLRQALPVAQASAAGQSG
jgi:hypothetical protein